MGATPLATAETILESLLADLDDEEARFKLRAALQLVVVARDEHDRVSETLGDAPLDDDLRARLQELGYLE